jgi:RimJ/RimL family protein N-acetyltransferase
VTELRGSRVTLRPFRPGEFRHVWEFRLRDGARPENRERLRRRYARSGTFHDGFLDLAIEAEGRLVGEIDARRGRNMMPEGVYELGIALFDEADRGRGYGREAVALMTGHLFRELGAGRVQGSTSVANHGMRRVFERCGFTFEGVMRGFMPGGDGARDDYALYAVTRADLHEQEP